MFLNMVSFINPLRQVGAKKFLPSSTLSGQLFDHQSLLHNGWKLSLASFVTATLLDMTHFWFSLLNPLILNSANHKMRENVKDCKMCWAKLLQIYCSLSLVKFCMKIARGKFFCLPGKVPQNKLCNKRMHFQERSNVCCSWVMIKIMRMTRKTKQGCLGTWSGYAQICDKGSRQKTKRIFYGQAARKGCPPPLTVSLTVKYLFCFIDNFPKGIDKVHWFVVKTLCVCEGPVTSFPPVYIMPNGIKKNLPSKEITKSYKYYPGWWVIWRSPTGGSRPHKSCGSEALSRIAMSDTKEQWLRRADSTEPSFRWLSAFSFFRILFAILVTILVFEKCWPSLRLREDAYFQIYFWSP